MLKRLTMIVAAATLASALAVTGAQARGGFGGGHGGGIGGGHMGGGHAAGFGGGFAGGHFGGMGGRSFGAAPRADVGRGFAFHDRSRGHDRDGHRFGRFRPGFAYYGYDDYDCGPYAPYHTSWRSYYCSY